MLRARFSPERPAAELTQDLVPSHAASIVIYHRGDEPLLPSAFSAGVYDLTASEPFAERVSAGWRLDQIDRELVESTVIVLPQSPFRLVQPGAELARLIVRRPVATTPACDSLVPELDAVIAALRQRLSRTAAPHGS